MNNPNRSHIIILLLTSSLSALVILGGCVKPHSSFDNDAYRREIEQWKDKRLTRLTSDTGWLTLCGLYWLKEGENSVGSDSTSDVILPSGKAPGKVGTILSEQGTLRFDAQPHAEIKSQDSLITSIVMHSDEEGDPTTLNIGTLSFYIIKRGDQLGVRVKDKQNRARLNFKGLEYFPLNPVYRFEATFERYAPAKILEIPSMVGTIEKDSCPGALAFTFNGTAHRIDVVIEKGSENQFFIMFGDETNGKETYQIGRQLYTDLPDSNNKVILDFNKAYNWPCVFTEYATCPIPPKQNRLPFRVEAGEKMYKGH